MYAGHGSGERPGRKRRDCSKDPLLECFSPRHDPKNRMVPREEFGKTTNALKWRGGRLNRCKACMALERADRKKGVRLAADKPEVIIGGMDPDRLREAFESTRP